MAVIEHRAKKDLSNLLEQCELSKKTHSSDKYILSGLTICALAIPSMYVIPYVVDYVRGIFEVGNVIGDAISDMLSPFRIFR